MSSDETEPPITQPKQAELFNAMESGEYRFILFGGALGTGKSHGLRLCNFGRRSFHPGTTSLIFRRTIPELRENHIDPMFRTWPEFSQFWNATEKVLRFPNGSSTTFASADDEKAIARFMGPEYGDIFVDQAEQISEDWIDRLKERNRQTGVPGFKPQFVMTANPGGISHAYLKRVFVDRKRYLTHEKPEDYHFIQAHAWDNVEWSRDALEADGLTPRDYYSWTDEERFRYFVERTTYGRTLDSKPPKRRAAMLLGDWSVYEGQFFDCFDPEKDPIPIDAVELRDWTPRWISMDWGFRHKTAVYWHAQVGERTVCTYREYITSGTGVDEIAHTIGALTNGERIRAFYLGGDAFAHKTDEQTIDIRLARTLAEYGIPAPSRAVDGPGSRRARGAVAYDRLGDKTLLIARTCPELINLLPELLSDPDEVETVLKVEGDDPWDGWSYGILTPDVKERVPPEEVVRRVAVAEFKKEGGDLTSTHLKALTEQQKVKRLDQPIRFGRRRYGRP